MWVGTADNTSAIFNQWGGIMYGSDAPTKIWKSILDTSLANVEQQSFPQAYPIHYGVGSWGSGYVYDPSQSTTWNQAPASPENEGDEEASAEDGEHHDEGQGETPDHPAQPEQPAEPAEPEVPSLDDILNGDGLDQLLGQ